MKHASQDSYRAGVEHPKENHLERKIADDIEDQDQKKKGDKLTRMKNMPFPRTRKSSFSHKILVRNNLLEKKLARMEKELHQLNLRAQEHAQQHAELQDHQKATQDLKALEAPKADSQLPTSLVQLEGRPPVEPQRTPFDMLESTPTPVITPKIVITPASNTHGETAGDTQTKPDNSLPREDRTKVGMSDQSVQVNTLQDSSHQLGAGSSKGIWMRDSRVGSQNFVRLHEEITSMADIDKVNETMITAKFAHSTSMFGQHPGSVSPIPTQNEPLEFRRGSNMLSLERNLNDSSALLLGVPMKQALRRSSIDYSQDLGDMTLAGQSPWMNSSMSRL